MSKLFFACLVFGLAFLQVHAQADENEILDDPISLEGSAVSIHSELPLDDEDILEEIEDVENIEESIDPDDEEDDSDELTYDDEDNENGSGSGSEIDIGEGVVDEMDYEVDPSTTTTLASSTTTQKADSEGKDKNSNEQTESPNNPKTDPLPSSSFFTSNQFMIAIIIGGVLGLLLAICVIALVAYRMRKKDEGSYPITDEKHGSNAYQYTQGQEFFA